MHADRGGRITVHHNGDWSGEAILVIDGEEICRFEGEDFRRLALGIIQSEAVVAVEQAIDALFDKKKRKQKHR